jgi:hypothetical protein
MRPPATAPARLALRHARPSYCPTLTLPGRPGAAPRRCEPSREANRSKEAPSSEPPSAPTSPRPMRMHAPLDSLQLKSGRMADRETRRRSHARSIAVRSCSPACAANLFGTTSLSAPYPLQPHMHAPDRPPTTRTPLQARTAPRELCRFEGDRWLNRAVRVDPLTVPRARLARLPALTCAHDQAAGSARHTTVTHPHDHGSDRRLPNAAQPAPHRRPRATPHPSPRRTRRRSASLSRHTSPSAPMSPWGTRMGCRPPRRAPLSQLWQDYAPRRPAAMEHVLKKPLIGRVDLCVKRVRAPALRRPSALVGCCMRRLAEPRLQPGGVGATRSRRPSTAAHTVRRAWAKPARTLSPSPKPKTVVSILRICM